MAAINLWSMDTIMNATPTFEMTADELKFKQPRSLISRMIAGSLTSYVNELRAEGKDKEHVLKQALFMIESHRKHVGFTTETQKVLKEKINELF